MPIYKPNKMVDAKFERLNTSTLESLQKSMVILYFIVSYHAF